MYTMLYLQIKFRLINLCRKYRWVSITYWMTFVCQYPFGIRLCSIVAKCWKSSIMAKIAYFHSFYWIWDLINHYSTQTTPCRYPFHILYSFPHPNMIKHWCWLNFWISFLTVFPISPIQSFTLKCTRVDDIWQWVFLKLETCHVL